MKDTIYVPRSFFSCRVIMDDVWLSNHHFMIRRSKVRNAFDFSSKDVIHGWGDGEYEGQEIITAKLHHDGEHGAGKIWASLCESREECQVKKARISYGCVDRAVPVENENLRAFFAEPYVDAFGLEGATFFGSAPGRPFFNAEDEKRVWLIIMPLKPEGIEDQAAHYDQATGLLKA